jgi:SsrA-binding protein
MALDLVNRKARFNYELIKTYTAGIKLLGTEVKSLRDGRCDFTDSYIYIEDGEVFLVNFSIPKYKPATIWNHEEKRKRKLLLNKREIKELNKNVRENRMTIVPTKIYIIGKYIKMDIALAKGKNTYDKKHALKEKDIQRQTKRELNF